MGTHYESPAGVVFRRNVWAIVCVAAPGLLAIAAFVAFPAFGGEGGPPRGDPSWFPLLSVAVCGSWIGSAVVWSRNAWPRERRGALRADATGITVDGQRLIHAEDIMSATLAKADWQNPAVRIRLRGQLLPAFVRVGSEEEGRAILAALHVDAAHTRATFALPWGPFRWGAGVVFYMYLWIAAIPVCLAGLLLSPRHPGYIEPLGYAAMGVLGTVLVAAYWVLWWRSTARLTIGTDGVLVSQWGRTRFIPAGEIAGVVAWPKPTIRGMRGASEGFDIELCSGERIGFYTAQERQRLGLLEGDVVADRLREAMSTRAARRPDIRIALQTRQKGAERVTRLRQAGSGASADLRTAALDLDDLWRLVEDSLAPPADRAAAATALSTRTDEPTRARLRIAAEATALPALRIAIQAAVDGDDAELSRALDELSAPSPAQGHRAESDS